MQCLLEETFMYLEEECSRDGMMHEVNEEGEFRSDIFDLERIPPSTTF